MRELTPIITAIVLAGRTGASFAARIATMQGNEEIDALTTLGVPPVEFLVLPRVVALTLLMPLLYVYGCAFALAGGLCVAAPILDISAAAYMDAARDAIGGANFAIGGLKAASSARSSPCSDATTGCRPSAARPASAPPRRAPSWPPIVGIIALDAVFAVCANALDI